MSTVVGALFDDCSTLSEEENSIAIAAIGADVTFDSEFGTSGSLIGSSGNDIFKVDDEFSASGKGGIDIVCADGVDVILGNSTEHAILAGTDDVNAYGGSGSNVIAGNTGDNYISGASGTDTLLGGAGDDTVDGGSGADVVYGGIGDDKVYGGSGADMLDGGEGDDTIDGDSGADTIAAGAGDDVVTGGSGADLIDGGDGNDTIDGESGDDIITGGAGDDVMTGGSGTDVFNFEDASGNDTITDFVAGKDHIGVMYGINGSSITDTADVLANISTNAFGDAVVDLGGGNTVTLEDVDAGDLTADDFFIFS